MEDSELKEGIRKGDRIALNEVYQRYFRRVFAWVRNHQGTEEDARDVFQEVLVIVYQQLQDPAFEIKYALGTYLYTLVRNVWLKRLRDDRVLGKASDEGLEFVPGDEVVEPDVQAQQEHLYRKMFLRLGEQCQQILQRFLAGESIRRITEALNLSSENYAKKRKFQCKQQLMKLIKEDDLYKAMQP